MTDEASLPDGWLDALPEAQAPCGPDLEYDNEFLELVRSAEGKPASQFAPAEPPNWPFVREKAEALMARTRDLRIAICWTRANVNLKGFSGLASGLKLVEGLLANFWECVHPQADPDDGDQFPRANALMVLAHPEGLCADIKQCSLFGLRGSGIIRYRTAAIAFNQIAPKEDEVVHTREQLAQMVASAVSENPGLAGEWRSVMQQARSLDSTVKQKFDAQTAPDLKPLMDMIKMVHGLLPADAASSSEAQTGEDAAAAASGAPVQAPGAKAPAVGELMSRDDVLRAIDRVCEYLDRVEPSNPAQLLLRRARRMINRDFLQLIKELAPDALNETARVLGVDPDSVNIQNGA